MKNLDEKIVLEIIKQHFEEIPKIKRFYSEGSYVAELKFKEFTRIIKINTFRENCKFEKEIYIFEILKTHNIPTPKIYFINLSNNKYPKYYIMESLGKFNLLNLFKSNSITTNNLFRQMGEYFAKIHSINLKKQGEISKKGILKKKFLESSKNGFNFSLNKLIELKALNEIEVKKSINIFSKFQDSNESVLCHMDFGPWQVIINDKKNKITGIIDWEWATISYSVADFAKAETLTSLFGCKFEIFKEGYEKIRKLPPNYNQIKIPYQLQNILGIMYHFKLTGDDSNFKKAKQFFNKLIF